MVDSQHIDAWPEIWKYIRGIETILAELATSDAKARQAKPEDFVDMRFVAELERDGFFKKLDAK